jgi:lysophospholipid acyltransferase (LPLAT)-like uncharacterized protein
VKITPARARWLSLLGSVFIRLLGRTWRIRRTGTLPPDWNILLAFLHGDILPTAYAFRGLDAAVMISLHGDGELIARVAERLDYVTVRGSSSRGGARAFLEMARGEADRPWGITPDGPRGPRGSVHPGVIQLAAQGSRAIVPLGVAFSRGWRFRSWDRFGLPAPFARIILHLGEALRVPADPDRSQREELAKDLANRLAEAERAARRGLTSGETLTGWPRRPPRQPGTHSLATRRDGKTPA